MSKHITTSRQKFFPCLIAAVFLATTLAVRATTYISVEPIPSRDVVGPDNLAKILSVGYPNLELWSNRLLNECGIVQEVIDVLASHGAISTVDTGRPAIRVFVWLPADSRAIPILLTCLPSRTRGLMQ